MITEKEVLRNFREFQKALNDSGSYTWKERKRFYHWYYLPKLEIFAPAKFIGYASTTKGNYSTDSAIHIFKHGDDAKKFLSPFFFEVEKGSSQFKNLYVELEKYCAQYSFRPNARLTSGTGAIYLPKEHSFR